MQFKDVVGQHQIKHRLVQMVHENRISHALLFSELPGSGGLSLAWAFAQYINCPDKTENDSCGHCPSCRKIAKLIHPDLHFSFPSAKMDKKAPKGLCSELMTDWREALIENPYLQLNDWYDFIGIENKQAIIREEESDVIVHTLSLMSFEGGYKIHIMWQADKLNITAANKLLKIIEEPPANTLFLLITENYEQLLPTILSRTQLIKIRRIAEKDFTNALVHNHEMDNAQAKRIMHLSDTNYASARQIIKEEQTVLDIEKRFLDWLRLCYKIHDNYKLVYKWVEDMAGEVRESQKNFLAFGLQTAREVMVTNYAGAEHSRFDEESFPGFARFATMLNENNIEQFVEELNTAHFHIGRNANPKILFLDLSFKMNRILRMKV
jgi:DNA polymerase-3 subunit delta'